jgi:hypothetical protein
MPNELSQSRREKWCQPPNLGKMGCRNCPGSPNLVAGTIF